jgi:hypothetical protein
MDEIRLPEHHFDKSSEPSPRWFCEKYIKKVGVTVTCYRKRGHAGQHRERKWWNVLARNSQGEILGISWNEGGRITWLPVLQIKRHLFYFSQRIPVHNRVHFVLGRDAVAPHCKGISWNLRNIRTGGTW